MQKKYKKLNESQLEQIVGGSKILPGIGRAVRNLGDKSSWIC